MDRTNACNYPEDIWNGDKPAHKGSLWHMDKDLIPGQCYETFFGSFETVLDDCIMVMGEYKSDDDTYFNVYGLYDPYMTVRNVQKGIHYSSKTDAPDLMAQLFVKAYNQNKDVFQKKLMQLFIDRVNAILHYDFPMVQTEDGWRSQEEMLIEWRNQNNG